MSLLKDFLALIIIGDGTIWKSNGKTKFKKIIVVFSETTNKTILTTFYDSQGIDCPTGKQLFYNKMHYTRPYMFVDFLIKIFIIKYQLYKPDISQSNFLLFPKLKIVI